MKKLNYKEYLLTKYSSLIEELEYARQVEFDEHTSYIEEYRDEFGEHSFAGHFQYSSKDSLDEYYETIDSINLLSIELLDTIYRDGFRLFYLGRELGFRNFDSLEEFSI